LYVASFSFEDIMSNQFLFPVLRGTIAAAALIGSVAFAAAEEPSFTFPTTNEIDASMLPDPDGPVPEAHCLVPEARFLASDLDAFLADPATLLSSFESGGLPLSNRVRQIAASDSRSLEPLVALVAAANDRQRPAIGSGLARAAFVCLAEHSVYAAMIQAKAVASDDEDFLTAFSDTLRDIQTAAILPGGAPGYAAAPSVSGAPARGAGTKGLFHDEAVAQSDDTISVTRRVFGSWTDDDDDGRSRNVSPSRVGP
jgi:hypothetical protein